MSDDIHHCCTPKEARSTGSSADLPSPRVREALLAIENSGALVNWRGLTFKEDSVRVVLLQMYAEHGRAPSIADLARQVEMDVFELETVLAGLQARDVIVRDKDSGAILGAYPFTEGQTGYQVDLGAQTLRAMCAIDALGIGAMFDRDVLIRSSCSLCGTSIEIATLNRGRELGYWTPETAIVWSGIRYEQGCAANSLCKVLAFFCSDIHLERWRRAQVDDAPGFRLSMQEGLEAGRALFEDSLKRQLMGRQND
jgi:hypothetical protein